MVGRAASPELLTSGIAGASGSTVGPDGALYVMENATGSVLRVNPQTGAKAVFATGLPIAHLGLGGAIDVAFLDDVAYVLVTLVGPDVGGASTVGLYRVDGASSFTIVADIGAFNIAHPPTAQFQIDVASGLQFALQPYRDGFLGEIRDAVLRISFVRFSSRFSRSQRRQPLALARRQGPGAGQCRAQPGAPISAASRP